MGLTPLRCAQNCFRRARRLLELADADFPVGQTPPRNDLRRLALVMAVAGLDTYLHGMVLRAAGRLRESGQLPASWRKLDVPIAELATLARSTVKARAEGKDSRPWVHVTNALQRRVLLDPFQSPDEINRAVALCGKKKIWESLRQVLGETPAQMHQRLNAIVQRRNHIVHEGDIRRRVKPHMLKWNTMPKRWCRESIEWLETFVKELDAVLLQEGTG